MAKVSIVMGSDSDMPVMAKTAAALDELGISYEMCIISAHREPDVFFEYAKTAEERGIRVIIAGAGMAAHLPGMCAALFPLMALMHSDEAAAKITQIADCFFEVCSDFKHIYLRAEKVPDPASGELYQPHILNVETGMLTLITDGVKLSRRPRLRRRTSGCSRTDTDSTESDDVTHSVPEGRKGRGTRDGLQEFRSRY